MVHRDIDSMIIYIKRIILSSIIIYRVLQVFQLQSRISKQSMRSLSNLTSLSLSDLGFYITDVL